MGFGVLGALYPFHTWSPDGHASAPTAVSMLHAGVLMKLGGFGCLKVMFLMPEGAKMWATFFLALTTVNIFYGALIACRKTDLKYITAYSSVSHCGLVIFGLSTLSLTGFQGAVVQMFAHGLMTALFFALIGMIYGRTHTRFITEMGGLIKVMPYLGVCYMIGGMAGLGLPGLAGFIAEFMVLVGSFPVYLTFTVIAATAVIITAAYYLWAMQRVFLGKLNPAYVGFPDVNWRERLTLYPLAVIMIVLGFYPQFILGAINGSLHELIKNIRPL